MKLEKLCFSKFDSSELDEFHSSKIVGGERVTCVVITASGPNNETDDSRVTGENLVFSEAEQAIVNSVGQK